MEMAASLPLADAGARMVAGTVRGTDPWAAARAAAQDFEAVFLTTMLSGMFEGLKTDPPFGGGHAEQSYRSLLVAEYAKAMSARGGIGIADHVYREIIAAQEGAQP